MAGSPVAVCGAFNLDWNVVRKFMFTATHSDSSHACMAPTARHVTTLRLVNSLWDRLCEDCRRNWQHAAFWQGRSFAEVRQAVSNIRAFSGALLLRSNAAQLQQDLAFFQRWFNTLETVGLQACLHERLLAKEAKEFISEATSHSQTILWARRLSFWHSQQVHPLSARKRSLAKIIPQLTDEFFEWAHTPPYVLDKRLQSFELHSLWDGLAAPQPLSSLWLVGVGEEDLPEDVGSERPVTDTLFTWFGSKRAFRCVPLPVKDIFLSQASASNREAVALLVESPLAADIAAGFPELSLKDAANVGAACVGL